MRIGTWNVEYAAGRAKNERRLRRLHAMACDIWILTETHDDLDLGVDYHAVSTRQRATSRPGARWTTIWSRYPIHETLRVEDNGRTVAVRVASPDGPLLVFGTVLPWHSDPGPAIKAPNWSEFYRVVPQQGGEWAALRKAHPGVAMCVAGDFNVNLGGKHYYGTTRARATLRTALADAALVCVTETERVPAGLLRYPPIDHIALSDALARRAAVVGAWEGDADDDRLSDHSGLVVEICADSPTVNG